MSADQADRSEVVGKNGCVWTDKASLFRAYSSIQPEMEQGIYADDHLGPVAISMRGIWNNRSASCDFA